VTRPRVVIIGGGFGGLAAAKVFRSIDTRKSRVILVEAGPRLLPALPALPEGSSARARRDLEPLGVEVRTGAMVTEVDENGARIGDELMRTRNVFWAAGIQGSRLGAMLGGPVDRAGRDAGRPARRAERAKNC
jgi:NADH dehydrogenase